jgi:hypothetical protein
MQGIFAETGTFAFGKKCNNLAVSIRISMDAPENMQVLVRIVEADRFTGAAQHLNLRHEIGQALQSVDFTRSWSCISRSMRSTLRRHTSIQAYYFFETNCVF